MKGYKSVSMPEEIHKEIENITKSGKYLYKNPSQFINCVLIEKLLDLRKLQLKEKEIELLEKK